MARSPSDLDEAALGFLAERHLATLTKLRRDGSPHVVAVGFAYSHGEHLVRVITGGGSQKAANARRGGRAVVCQVDGRRWLALEGTVSVRDDPDSVATAETAYAARYRVPAENPNRVVVEIAVDRVLGRG
jgi:F420H(2)-dependent biliverdin reductase